MPVIDAHVHLYPEEVWQNPREWSEPREEKHWSHCVAPTSRETIQGWANIDTLLRDMDDAEIEKVILLGWYWENIQTCQEQNQWYARWIKEYPDRIDAFAALNATADVASDIVTWAFDNGFIGIGECLPQAQGHTLRDSCWRNVMEACVAKNLPINLHVTEPVGHDYSGRVETPLEDYVWLASEYPEAKLILAHWGGLLPLYEMNPTVHRKMANVFYDTAASPLLFDKSIFRTVVNAIGSERILYGSDYPLRLYPSKSKTPDFKTFLEDIHSTGLSSEEIEDILHRNARKLFG